MSSPTEPEQAYVPRREPASGPQLLVVFFGSRTCSFCNRPAFKAAVRRMGSLLGPQASAAGRSVHLAAVAVAWDAREGIEYLRELGEFDEVSAGGSWWNTVVGQRLFSRDRPAVPTLVLYERVIIPSVEENTLVFGPERELQRFVGSDTIEAWIAAGCPVTDLLLPVKERADPMAAT
jgi:hypothetical protein